MECGFKRISGETEVYVICRIRTRLVNTLKKGCQFFGFVFFEFLAELWYSHSFCFCCWHLYSPSLGDCHGMNYTDCAGAISFTTVLLSGTRYEFTKAFIEEKQKLHLL